jgi:hypothetical protein
MDGHGIICYILAVLGFSVHARHMLYHLLHPPALFCFLLIFQVGSCIFFPGTTLDLNPSTYGNTGAHYHNWFIG